MRIGFPAVTAALAAVTFGLVAPRASSHRKAPLISQDPYADNTDVYSFVSPRNPDRVTLITNFIPIEAPQAGPNYYKFDDNVLYELMVDNDADAVEDVTFQFRFRTETRNLNTFLYNTGQVTSLDDTDLNVRQFYTVTRVEGPRRSGRATVLAENLPVAPVNVGVRSFPDYASVAAAAVRQLPNNSQVFAGQRDEGFYVDVGGVFDLLGVPPADARVVDGLAGVNVHSIAIEVPITSLTASGSRPGSASSADAVIGVWSTASRPSVTSRGGGRESQSSRWVQVSRLGQPLVNELVIPRSTKDAFNALEPTGDSAALGFVQDPEPARLLTALPDDEWNDGVIGDAHLELGEYDEAFAAFDRMMARRLSAAAYARVSYARELQGDLDGAILLMTMAREATSPHDPEAQAWHDAQLGYLYIEQGRLREARRSFERAAFVFPEHPFAVEGLALLRELGTGNGERGTNSQFPGPGFRS